MTGKTITSTLTYAVFIVLMTACATIRPVLYPNAYLNTVGMEAADADIQSCMAMAKAAGAEQDKVNQATKKTVQGAVIGGATGGAVGAVLGHVGQGVATGAAGAATGNLTRTLLDDKPDPVYQSFVDRCLRDKGYEPIGWR